MWITLSTLSAHAYHLPYNLPYQKHFAAYLTYEIALNEGNSLQAGVSALTLARLNRDAQMAQQALYLLMQAHAYDKAQKAASLWLELEPSNVYAQQRYQALALQNMPLAQRVRVMRSQIDGLPFNQQPLRLQDLVLQLPDPKTALQTFEQVVQGRLDSLPITLAIMSDLALRANYWQEAFQYAVEHYQNQPHNEANLLFIQSMFVRQWNANNPQGSDNEPFRPWEDRHAVTLKQEGVRQADLWQTLSLTEAFLKQHPEAYKVRLGYSKLLILVGNNPQAIEQLDRLQKRFPRGVTVLFYKGIAAYRQENYSVALKALDHFLRVASGYPDGNGFEGFENMVDAQDYARRLLANCLSAMGQHRAARYQLSLIDNQTDLVRMLKWREVGLAGSAQRALKGLEQIKPTTWHNKQQYVLIQAQVLVHKGQLRQATHVLSVALHTMPQHLDQTDIVLALSALYQARHDDNASIQLLKRYVEQTENPHLMAALSVALSNQVMHNQHSSANHAQQLKEAMSWAQKAMKAAPYAADSHDALGWVLLQMDQYQAAIRDFQQALNIAVKLPIQLHLLQAYWQAGQPDEAYQLADTLLRRYATRKAALSLMTTLGMKQP